MLLNKGIVSLILAAGRSRRMGRDKALFRIEDETLLEKVIHRISVFSEHIYIVLGRNFDPVKSWLEKFSGFSSKYTLIFNENSHLGMFSSLQKGLAGLDKGSYVLVQMVDQPFVPQQIYWEMIRKMEVGDYVLQPAKMTDNVLRKGHPLIISPEFASIILAESLDSNLKEVIDRYPDKRRLIMTDSDLIFTNLNNPEDVKDHYRSNEHGNTG